DVFIRIFQKLSHYSGKVPVKHWVSRVAVNICTNAYHKAKACQELRMADLGEEEAEVIQSLACSEGELEPSQSWAARELVDKLLTTLSADDRTLVDFICLQGYTYNQVRDLTGWNLSAMKVRMFRVRKRLEKTLTRLSREEPLPLVHFPICRVDEALRFSCGA
ncbi:MAG: RNA polymerase sigma factor, partial [Verrucomicrobiota bacterium]